jgi:hypothetical protein
MDFPTDNLTVSAIHAYLADRKRKDTEEHHKHEKEAKERREKLHQAFLGKEVPPDAMGRIARLVRKAVQAGDKEVLVLRFPSDWLPDQGRSITSHDKAWPRHLEGYAKDAYEYYERELAPRGFQLACSIVDWPGGMPGDAGFFLRWKQPEEV